MRQCPGTRQQHGALVGGNGGNGGQVALQNGVAIRRRDLDLAANAARLNQRDGFLFRLGGDFFRRRRSLGQSGERLAALHLEAKGYQIVGRNVRISNTGEIDIVAAGLAIRSERALHVNFSQPYAAGGIALATNSARTSRVQRFEDLDAETYKVAAVESSVAVALARRLLPNASLVTFASTEEASAALVEGSVDAYLEDEPVPTFLALEHEGTIDLPLARPLLQSRSGFAVNKGDADFLAFLNAWIVEREDDTWLPTTQRYWFKSLEWRER